jgi:site-specific DNA-methyltransferase (adenine-specific)
VPIDADLSTHWIASTFSSATSSTDRDALAQSIVQSRKIVDPIVLYEGQILDGRSRHDIAREHGIACSAIHFEQTDEGIGAGGNKEELDRAARDFLFQKNVVRRHYTSGQRAAIAAQLATMPQGARTDLEPSAALRKVAQPEAATLCGVSVRSVQHAERIFREGTADEIKDMWAGAPLEPIVHAIAERAKKRKRRSLTVVSSSPERSPSASLLCGDLLHVLPALPDDHFDSCAADPPYGLGMDQWDAQVPSSAVWHEIYRVLKPGAWCLAFGAPRTYHHLAAAIEEAGFSIQDMGEWINTGKMAKKNGLKPAHEPFCIAQKPYEQSLAYNEQKWGVGLINIEDARIPWDKIPPGPVDNPNGGWRKSRAPQEPNPKGRHPFNVVGYLDEEHLKFFYAPRASVLERGYFNHHPTPKPIALMRWLIKIYSPRTGLVLDPFMGSGSTGLAAVLSGRSFVGIDINRNYVGIAKRRFEELVAAGEWDGPLHVESA